MAYTAIGEAVPKKLWLTYFVAKDDGKIDIKGESVNVEDITIFFKNMKDSLLNTQLRLHKLELKSSTVDDAIIDLNSSSEYQFELTNMTDAELSPASEENLLKDNSTTPQASEGEAAKNPAGKKNPITNLGEIEENGD